MITQFLGSASLALLPTDSSLHVKSTGAMGSARLSRVNLITEKSPQENDVAEVRRKQDLYKGCVLSCTVRGLYKVRGGRHCEGPWRCVFVSARNSASEYIAALARLLGSATISSGGLVIVEPFRGAVTLGVGSGECGARRACGLTTLRPICSTAQK